MTDKEMLYRRLYQKYGDSMAAREVMRELGIGSTRKLNAIPEEGLPRCGGGRRGVRVVYMTSDVSDYILHNPPRRMRGNQVEINPRELIRFHAKYQLSPQEKAGLMDAWSAAFVYGDESANLDPGEASSLAGCDEGLLRRLVKRGIPLNPLQSGVFGVAA